MPDVLVRGRRLSYDIQPLDFDQSSPAVVFIHGSGGSREDWAEQLRGLSSLVTSIALDLPGHGDSEPPGEASVQAYADWVTAFVEALGLQYVALVGCSLGSAVTQQIALSPGPWLKAIGLVGAGARLKVSPALLKGLVDETENTVRVIAGLCLSPDAGDSLKRRVREQLASNSPELLHKDFSACDEFDVMKSVHEIHLPACIIVGADDKLTPVKYSQFLHDKISASRLDVIPKSGHLVMLEKPDDFNRCLIGFLREEGLIDK